MGHPDGTFRTDDMSLAATLVCAGFSYHLVKLNSTKAAWVFEPTEAQEEDFDDLVDDYRQFRHSVEPRAFLQEVGRMRSELYELIPPRPKRTVPSAAQA